MSTIGSTHDDGATAEAAARPPRSRPPAGIGIDLGTTNCSVAYLPEGTRTPRIVPLENTLPRERLPSVVFFDRQANTLVVGDNARRRARVSPEFAAYEFKRGMPRASSALYILGDSAMPPTRTETPETLSAALLAEIKKRTERALTREHGVEVTLTRAVITVPANFPEEAPAATRAAALAAGFTDVILIDEPSAAALAYALQDSPQNRTIVVFDFGGGTLDCSILTTPGENGKPFSIKYSNGNPALGGKDFDEDLVLLLRDSVQAASRLPRERGRFDVLSDDDIGISRRKRLAWRAELKAQAERIKAELSEAEVSSFAITSDRLVDYDDRPLIVEGEITRAQFERVTMARVEQAIEVLDRTLAEASLYPEDVDRLILVGGTTLIPAVTAALTRRFGIAPYGNIDRLTAVAQGAAIYEYSRRPRLDPPPHMPGTESDPEPVEEPLFDLPDGDILDVVASHNFGIRVGLNQLDTLIRKNDLLPNNPVTRTYRPMRTGDSHVKVDLYQYDETLVARATDGIVTVTRADQESHQAYKIGTLHVDGLPTDTPFIDITFRMDRNRILTVVARRQSDGFEFPLTIERTR